MTYGIPPSSYPTSLNSTGQPYYPVMGFRVGIKAHREQPLSNCWETAGLEAAAPLEHPN